MFRVVGSKGLVVGSHLSRRFVHVTSMEASLTPGGGLQVLFIDFC